MDKKQFTIPLHKR